MRERRERERIENEDRASRMEGWGRDDGDDDADCDGG